MITLKKSLMTVAMSVSATLVVGSTFAGDKYPPPPPPEKQILCHNIGGPRDLGADCEATGNCTFILPDGTTMTFTGDQFLGILVGAQGEGAIAAHLAHGDGFAIAIYDPPLHLASVVGPHQESNVECLATRVIPQPTEPGN